MYYVEEKRDQRKSLAFQTMYNKKKGTDSSDGFAVNSTAPITPKATPDNLDSISEGKGNSLPSDKQANGAGSSKKGQKPVDTGEKIEDFGEKNPTRTDANLTKKTPISDLNEVSEGKGNDLSGFGKTSG